MSDWNILWVADLLTRAHAEFAMLDQPVQLTLALLVGALLLAVGARLALAAAIGLIVYELVGPSGFPPDLEPLVRPALAILAVLGLFQGILNLALGRDAGGTALWSLVAFVGLLAVWRGPGALLRLLRFRRTGR